MSEQERLVAGADPATAEVLTLKNPGVATLLEVFAHPWPRLHRLEFEVRGDNKAAAKAIVSGFEQFFRKDDLPALRHLSLGGGSFDEGVLRILIDSPLLDRLESLDFAGERVSSETRAGMVGARERFGRLQLFPKADDITDVRVLLGRAQLARDLGLLDRALELLDRAIAQGGTHVHLAEKSNILARLGRLDEALAAVELALVRDPYFFPCWAQKIDVLRKLGRMDDALNAAKETRRRVHKEEQRLQSVAMGMDILREVGRVQDMETEAMWALADVDDDEEPSAAVHFWMAVIHALLENTDAAMTRLAAACEKEPKLRKKARQEDMLRSIAKEPRFATIVAEAAT
jgi:tetratricopeptide (TPR) repeat protein